jgi:hypothetical protein
MTPETGVFGALCPRASHKVAIQNRTTAKSHKRSFTRTSASGSRRLLEPGGENQLRKIQSRRSRKRMSTHSTKSVSNGVQLRRESDSKYGEQRNSTTTGLSPIRTHCFPISLVEETPASDMVCELVTRIFCSQVLPGIGRRESKAMEMNDLR